MPRIQTVKKAVRMLNEHGPGFLVRNAIWRVEYVRFQRLLELRQSRGETMPSAIRFLDHEFELHPSGKGLSQELALFGTHEPLSTSMYLRHLKPGDQVVDIGSNMGYYLLLAAREVGPSGQLLGFEPARSVYEILQRNVNRYGHSNIRLFPWAIGAKNDTTTFYESEFPNWGSLLRDDRLLPNHAATVQMRRLDDLRQEFSGFRPSVLRMDVEGAELMVLQGARQILKECQPTLFIEFHPFAVGWEATRAAILELRDLGYSSGILIERDWDHPWMSKWARERRCWSKSTDELLRRIESTDSTLTGSVFSLILKSSR